MQLKVIKADGSLEEYLHTKVMGTISNALANAGQPDICLAEQLAEAVTYYLYHRHEKRCVTSCEIFSVVKASLSATGYEEAAIALTEHHFERKIKRSRIEVVAFDIDNVTDIDALCNAGELGNRSRWNKSIIVDDLTARYGIPRQTARTIAALVEEKIFNIGVKLVPAGLVKQLVLGDTAVMLRAQRQLQIV